MNHIRVRLLHPLQPKDPGPIRRHSQRQIPHDRSRGKTQTGKQLARKVRLASAGCQPFSTLFGVNRLAFPELLIEIEATATA